MPFALRLLCLIPVLCLPLSATTVAYWNFNQLSISGADSPGTGDVPITLNADHGSGSIDLSHWIGNIDDFAGSAINALDGDPADTSLSLIAGSGDPHPGNGSSIIISFSLTALSNPTLSFTSQGTSTGFNSNQLAFSTDGSNFTNFGDPYTPESSYSLQQFDLSSVDSLDGAESVSLRLTFSGASGSSGNNRIDNLRISAIPEPSALLLTSLGIGLLLSQRRR